jgi:hypothetical protein
MNNPAHKKMFDFYKGCFNVKSGEIYETQWHCKLFRGANEEEITMDDLSDDQKMQIELGIATFDEITKDMRGSKIGNRISEIRLIRPTNKYEGEMKVLTEYTEDDLFITETKDESWDEVLNKEEGSSTTFEEAEIFG